MKSDMLMNELIDFNIGHKIRKLMDIDVRAKKEKSLFYTLEGIRSNWDVTNKIPIDEKWEIQKPDDIFDDIDDSLTKVADVQSSKYAP